MRIFLFSCLLLLVFPSLTTAQIQSPDQFLPHKLGENFTPHHILVDYVQHVAQNSSRVKLIQYGKTFEDRPLYIAVVSSEDNIANIENLRKNNLRKTGLIPGNSDASLDKAFVWLSYSVHGNEAGGAESSMAVLHALSDVQNKETTKWLANTVVIIDPSLNPDGYSRYSHWNRNMSNLHPNATRGTREHREPWPGGRVNHYLFDLNRDWAWQTQVESEERMKIYREWMPHIHADLHEQYPDNPYYFAPAAEPFHKYITDWQRDFQTEIGKNHAKYFDKNGWLYFTREIFDLFYPSYGDTYPTFNGAIGMTYEQAGHGISGRAIDLENEDVLKLSDRIAHHKTTSLSTIEIASENASRLVENFENYFEQANNNPQGKYQTYIIKRTNNPDKMKALCALLDKNGIRYGMASRTSGVKAFDYQRRKDLTLKVESRDLLISAAQPLGVLAQVLLDPDSKLSDSLTYDITAWALPYVYGLEAFATTEKLEVREGGYDFETYTNTLSTKNNAYAYFIRWQSLQDAQFLAALLKSGVKVRAASKSFSNGGNPFSPGTLVITKADNKKIENLAKTIKKISTQFERTVYAASTGFAERGNDLGSESMHLLKSPRIAVLSGEKTDSHGFGQVWYYFEQELDYPVDVYNVEDVNRINLHDYQVLILPEGRYNFSFKTREKISDWVSKGGRTVTIGTAVRAFADKDGFDIKKYATDSAKSDAESESDKTSMKNRLDAYDSQGRSFITYASPGAIFKLKMDNSHPLAYGLQKEYFSLKTSGLAFQHLKGIWNVGTVGENPEVIGFVGAKAKEKMKNTTTYAVEDKGAGELIYLIDNPLYRCFWENGKFLFANAVFMK